MNDSIPEDVLKTLEERFGSRFVRRTDGEAAPDVHDTVASVFPQSAEEVESLTRLAARHGIPLVARGAGTAIYPGKPPRGLTVRFDAGGRDRQKLEELEEQVRAHGGEALVIGVHLAKRHHPAHLVEAAVEAFGRLDALLFMACASAPPFASLDVDAWERSLGVNVRGFIYCLAAALPAMHERGGGRVVVAGVEDTEGAPDPLLRAWRAAVRTILEELP